MNPNARFLRLVAAFLSSLVWLARPLLGADPAATSSPIDLATVLRLAGAKPHAVEAARIRLAEARSLHRQDRNLFLPWIAPGIGFRRHDGNLQDIAGYVFDASKQSANAAVTLQAQLEIGDALYRSLASRQEVRAAEAAQLAEQRGAAGEAAALYTELARAHAAVAAHAEAVRIADDLIRQVRSAAEAGVAFRGDVHRAEAQHARNLARLARATEESRLASVRLARHLRLPPTVELAPDLRDFTPADLVSTHRSLDELVASALVHRPELARETARATAARSRRNAAARGPWIPSLGAQSSFGGLAGGRNGDFGNADDYQDYGVGLSWRIGPGGIGDGSRIETAEARLRLARLEEERTREAVTAEVVEARVRSEASSARLDAAVRAAESASRLLQLTLERRSFGVGAVLEAVEAERELTQARLDQVQALADQQRAQWALWHAIGAPVPASAPVSR